MSDSPSLALSWPADDVALITFDVPGKGANVLSRAVLEELSATLDAVDARPGVVGVILMSGKPGQYLAGADLREFAAKLDADASHKIAVCRQGQQLFQRLSSGAYPSVAAIAGICLGGGAELAAWCDARLFCDTPRTEFGFPEVRLGLIPGWGGTARAPRLVGLSHAVEMISGGRAISARDAVNMGWGALVDSIDALLLTAMAEVRRLQSSGSYLQLRQAQQRGPEMSEAERAFLAATATAVIRRETGGSVAAPQVALELILSSQGQPVDAACQREAEEMSRLWGSPQNRALLNVFFLQDRNKREASARARGRADHSSGPIPLPRVGVVGAGVMGVGIAAAHVRRHQQTWLMDLDSDRLEAGIREVLEEAGYDREVRQATPEGILRGAAKLRATGELEHLAACGLVIEAVTEDPLAKRDVLRQLDALLDGQAVLATNTSTIPIGQLAEGLRRADRFCGIHFFNPVRRMQLVEIIAGPLTSDTTTSLAVAHVQRLGKMPVVVQDRPGFLVNRLLMPYLHEALQLLAEGVSPAEIDRAATTFGMPMGPCQLLDLVGLDTAVHAGAILCAAYAERHAPSSWLPGMVQAGRLGRKSGRGFYRYDPRKPQPVDDAEAWRELLPREAQSASIAVPDQTTLTDRLILPMLNEACIALEESLVASPRDIDTSLIFAAGFPAFRGGLLYWAQHEGLEEIVHRMERFSALGPRFVPSTLLVDAARGGGSLYGPES